jgi:hypothetical protein
LAVSALSEKSVANRIFSRLTSTGFPKTVILHL